MQWTMIEPPGWWNLPATISRGGRQIPYTKNRRPHRLPLPGLWEEFVRPVLEANRSADPWVFPSPRRSGEPLDALSVPPYCRRLVAEGDLPQFTAKDLRTSFVTLLGQLGISRETRQRLVNHVDRSVLDMHYDLYDYDREKLAAMESWDSYLRRLFLGEKAAVVPLRR